MQKSFSFERGYMCNRVIHTVTLRHSEELLTMYNNNFTIFFSLLYLQLLGILLYQLVC
jgi:hypothetical protein